MIRIYLWTHQKNLLWETDSSLPSLSLGSEKKPKTYPPLEYPINDLNSGLNSSATSGGMINIDFLLVSTS